jgi:hypothetical protein
MPRMLCISEYRWLILYLFLNFLSVFTIEYFIKAGYRQAIVGVTGAVRVTVREIMA